MTPKYGKMCYQIFPQYSIYEYVTGTRWKSGGADSMQVWSFGTKMILMTSVCALI